MTKPHPDDWVQARAGFCASVLRTESPKGRAAILRVLRVLDDIVGSMDHAVQPLSTARELSTLKRLAAYARRGGNESLARWLGSLAAQIPTHADREAAELVEHMRAVARAKGEGCCRDLVEGSDLFLEDLRVQTIRCLRERRRADLAAALQRSPRAQLRTWWERCAPCEASDQPE